MPDVFLLVVASALAALILPGIFPDLFATVCYSPALLGMSLLNSLSQLDGAPAWMP